MIETITQEQIAILASLHLVYVILMGVIGWYFLEKSYRFVFIGLASIGWLWSLSAMINFNQQDTGFFSWFLDPAAEKNFTAILTSILLVLIGTTALVLLWKTITSVESRNNSNIPPLNLPPLRKGRLSAPTLSIGEGVGGGEYMFKINRFILSFYWFLLAVMFLFLAVDEYASLHENFTWWRQTYLGLGGSIALLSLLVAVFDKSLRPYVALFIIGLGSLGFAGVILDAFSSGNIISVGPIELDMFACRGFFLGVDCRDFGNTEELWEFVGASMMWLSLMSVIASWQYQKITHRILAVVAGVWAFVTIGWMWIFPAIENQLVNHVQIIYDDITVTGYSVSQDRVSAGDTLHVTIYAQVNHSLTEDYSMSIHLYTQPDAGSIANGDMLLGEFFYPTRAWIPNVPIRNRFEVPVPQVLETGESYLLVAMLWKEDAMSSIPANASDHPTILNNQIIILQNLPALSETIDPAPDNGGYQFAEGFSLDGYQMPESVQAGDVISLKFWWSAEQDVQTDLIQYLHLTNIETEDLFVFDQVPFAGQFPTSSWLPDMHEVDEWLISIPADIPPATYRIDTGLYSPITGERMPVTDNSGQPVLHNTITLGEWVAE